jgi:hypothetical protein
MAPLDSLERSHRKPIETGLSIRNISQKRKDHSMFCDTIHLE